MRIIFMGTPDFSVGTLKALVEAGHEVVLAVSQPDKPKGRGGKLLPTPVKEAACVYGISVFQPKRIRDPECIEELRKYEADIMVVVAFGQILPKEILEMTPYGCVNVHASLLPKYRGAAPIQWAVINGEKVSGVTTMQMDEGLDTGDMLLKVEVALDEAETGESLHDKLADAGARLCVETLRALEEGTVVPQKQGDSPTEYARMLDKGMGRIDWNMSAVAIERLIRGLDSWPGAYTDWDGKVMKIWGAKVLSMESWCGEASEEEVRTGTIAGEWVGEEAVPMPLEKEARAGTIIKVEKDGFCVKAGTGVLKVTSLQIPGKKRMRAEEFLRGYRIREGEVLG